MRISVDMGFLYVEKFNLLCFLGIVKSRKCIFFVCFIPYCKVYCRVIALNAIIVNVRFAVDVNDVIHVP
jgi:hypothetical protein